MTLRYEPLTAAHAPALFPVLSSSVVWTYVADSDERTLDEMVARYARTERGPGPDRPTERWVNFALRLPDGTCCGRIEATVHEAGSPAPWAEIAYLLGPAFWGRGLAQEAVAWLLTHLEEQHQVYEVWAAVQPDNARSCRLLARLGFQPVQPDAREVYSWDPGDALFRLDRGARRAGSGRDGLGGRG